MKRPFEDNCRLVRECISGDQGAWQRFTEKYSGLISIAIETRLKKYGFHLSPADIEDIRQNILVSLWRGKKLEKVRGRGNISYWLAVVSGNMAIGYIRKKMAAEPVKPLSIFDTIGENTIADIVPSPRENPKDEFLQGALRKKITELVGSLPAKERLVIKLNIIHGKKYDEISDILKMPSGTVSSYVKRAKERLRKELKDFF